VFRKGTSADKDAYSGFEGRDERGRALSEVLRKEGVSTIYVAGLATDYCVKATVLDGLDNGFEVCAVTDAMRPVDVTSGDGARALEEMKARGARLVTGKELTQQARRAERGR
jgi:nicotinamidase/pyrazinamidase